MGLYTFKTLFSKKFQNIPQISNFCIKKYQNSQIFSKDLIFSQLGTQKTQILKKLNFLQNSIQKSQKPNILSQNSAFLGIRNYQKNQQTFTKNTHIFNKNSQIFNKKLVFFQNGIQKYRNSQIFSQNSSFLGIRNYQNPNIFSKNLVFFENGIKKHRNWEIYNLLQKREYYVDRYQVHHFRPRGPKKWFQNPRTVITVITLGSGIIITVYFGNLETVPYTKRKHFVLLTKSLEKQIGESQFNQMKGSFKGKILPAIHPESVRVRLIAKDIIEALQRGLRHDQSWNDLGYGVEGSWGDESESVIVALSENNVGKWCKEDEILDDKWVQESRKTGSKPNTSHMEGLNWEVIVVNEPVVNAFCLPGGKIVVFTGLLEHFKSDAEVATIIGHEVGHAVARHAAEGITKNLWFAILQLILYQFVMPDIVNTMSTLFLRLPFSRRMEMEADYIGLLLIASAGYDPRVAPTVYEKLGKITGESALRDYLSTHPSGKKRAQLLEKAQVMEEAMGIYREVQSGKGVEGFL